MTAKQLLSLMDTKPVSVLLCLPRLYFLLLLLLLRLLL
jgi:hypothetical protein